MTAWWANQDQNEWMDYLDSLPPDKKCYCGWNRICECTNTEECKAGKSAADKRAAVGVEE